MIYKVFYQETKDRNPRRETTHALYLDIDAPNERENTPYNIEFITLLSDQHLEYEKESGAFEITEF